MRGLKFVLGLMAVAVVTGCAQLPADQQPSVHQLLSIVLPDESCEVLGTVTARAECNCYDKMSYDRVRQRASEKLQEQARQQYPDTDLVKVGNVDLFLNNAVAHGVAYQCLAKSS